MAARALLTFSISECPAAVSDPEAKSGGRTAFFFFFLGLYGSRLVSMCFVYGEGQNLHFSNAVHTSRMAAACTCLGDISTSTAL